MKELQTKEKDKIEQVKQQVQQIQTVFDYTLKPKRGHALFEVNLLSRTIEIAQFDEQPIVKYEDAVKGKISTKKKITKKENCIYISALNKKNVLKILQKLTNIQ